MAENGLFSKVSDRLIGALAGPVADAVGDAVDRQLGALRDAVDAGGMAAASEVVLAIEAAFEKHDGRLAGYGARRKVDAGHVARADALAVAALELVETFNRQAPKLEGDVATYRLGTDVLARVRKVEQLVESYREARKANP